MLRVPKKRPPTRASRPRPTRPGVRAAPAQRNAPQPSAPPAGPVRRAVSRHSATALATLGRLPRLAVPVFLGVLLLAGLAAPPVIGAVCLAAVLLFVGWLGYLSWPLASPG